MMRKIQYELTQENEGQTIARFLRGRGLSHQLLVRLKKHSDGILLCGAAEYVTARLPARGVLELRVYEDALSETITPAPHALDIVYEDEDVFVIHKPADMAVHPSHGNHETALACALAALYQIRGEPFVFRAIGRLDKNTSGLVLLAKNALSACLLSAKQSEIRREYIAICAGQVPANGTIDAGIARVPGCVLRREVHAEGARAVTHFARLATGNGLSIAQVWLSTGRTHQIRVHMAHIGHPIIGDFLYNPDFSHIERHALHAFRLSFAHPISHKQLCFTAALPDDMARVCTEAFHKIPEFI